MSFLGRPIREKKDTLQDKAARVDGPVAMKVSNELDSVSGTGREVDKSEKVPAFDDTESCSALLKPSTGDATSPSTDNLNVMEKETLTNVPKSMPAKFR